MNRIYTLNVTYPIRCDSCDKFESVKLEPITGTMKSISDEIDELVDDELKSRGWKDGICRECYFVEPKYHRDLAKADED